MSPGEGHTRPRPQQRRRPGRPGRYVSARCPPQVAEPQMATCPGQPNFVIVSVSTSGSRWRSTGVSSGSSGIGGADAMSYPTTIRCTPSNSASLHLPSSVAPARFAQHEKERSGVEGHKDAPFTPEDGAGGAAFEARYEGDADGARDPVPSSGDSTSPALARRSLALAGFGLAAGLVLVPLVVLGPAWPRADRVGRLATPGTG